MGVIGERAHSRSHRYPDLEDFATAMTFLSSYEILLLIDLTDRRAFRALGTAVSY